MWIQQLLYYQNWRCNYANEVCRMSVLWPVSWKLEMDGLYGICLQKAAEHWADWSFSLFVIARLCVHMAPWWSGDPLWCDAEPEFSKQRVGASCTLPALPVCKGIVWLVSLLLWLASPPSLCCFSWCFIVPVTGTYMDKLAVVQINNKNITIKNQAWSVTSNVLLITNYSPCEFWCCQPLSGVWYVLGR